MTAYLTVLLTIMVAMNAPSFTANKKVGVAEERCAASAKSYFEYNYKTDPANKNHCDQTYCYYNRFKIHYNPADKKCYLLVIDTLSPKTAGKFGGIWHKALVNVTDAEVASEIFYDEANGGVRWCLIDNQKFDNCPDADFSKFIASRLGEK